MGDLAAGVHSGIGTARHGQPGRRIQREDPAERLFDDLLNRPQARLRRPAMKA
jgi:hypothetical protein